jgi:protoporphyrinogen oxidase
MDLERKTQKRCVIIGAGPAGLTTAYELQRDSQIQPVIHEMTGEIGGIARTVRYKGNRMDIGGHRFFSKSDWVMQWWQTMFPMQKVAAWDYRALGRDIEVSDDPDAPHPDEQDRVMLVRNRLSRIFYLRKFFDYPISLSVQTVINLGLLRTFLIGVSYLKARLFPIRNETSLRDFLINRFGKKLYQTFFENYTEKVWGVPCESIKPEWGAQRIKGLSITKAVLHYLKKSFTKDSGIAQKQTETSLIEQFMYPKFGPGQMWEVVAEKVKNQGGTLTMGSKAVGINWEGNRILSIVFEREDGSRETVEGDYFVSTMPVKDLIRGFTPEAPENVRAVADGLAYRDFMTVGVLCERLKIKNNSKVRTLNDLVPDTWIYIQEADVKIGRLQIFNNWSPYLVSDPEKVWMGLEYFCYEDDALYTMEDEAFKQFAIAELASIGILDPQDVLDTCVIRQPKTYPGYFGTYDRFQEIRDFTDPFENLFLIGRNGMHRYNNMDHSMLTAREAVTAMVEGSNDKSVIWNVNVEKDYHEEKKTTESA